ncbi:glycosyltransferase family 61 protein [Fulvivirgaceae bacterium BMA12]|uniref:Glycosyltransferase family 61 protein n=1 Tax=Agaribacillus aureus TaxID=3051825 RepID=A0ABT8LA26_9BACT|nr:glycosyltransferase family 61 protein [Fulvivirgaceae bacterium BMA12]
MNFLPAHELLPYYQYKKQQAVPFDPKAIANLPDNIRDQFKKEASTGYEEFLIAFKNPCIIEPKSGWVLTEDFRTIAESRPYGRSVLPEFLPAITAGQYDEVSKVQIEEAVVLYEGCENYFHFLNEFVGRLILLDQLGVPRDIPIIIPEKMKEITFVNQFFDLLPDLFSRNWVYQPPDVFYRIKKCTYLVQVMKHNRRNLASLAEGSSAAVEDFHKADQDLHLFITRSKISGRGLLNMDKIEAVALKHGFTIIDPEQESVEKQIKLFSRARHVIGPHGAGNVNLVFRGDKPLKLLEIFPENFIKGTYFFYVRILAMSTRHYWEAP